MATTILVNTYSDGVFSHSEIAGTFDNHDDAEAFLKDHICYGGTYTQIAPCGYERLNSKGERFQHISLKPSNGRRRDINGRWENV